MAESRNVLQWNHMAVQRKGTAQMAQIGIAVEMRCNASICNGIVKLGSVLQRNSWVMM